MKLPRTSARTAMRSRAFLSYEAWRRAHPDQRPETVAVILAAANRLHLVDDPDVDRRIGHAGYARNRRRRGQRCRHGMAISPMASRAMALSYSRLDRLGPTRDCCNFRFSRMCALWGHKTDSARIPALPDVEISPRPGRPQRRRGVIE